MKLLAKEKLKLALLFILQIIFVIAPVIVLIILKRNDYFGTPEKVFSLSLTGAIVFLALILQIVGKAPKNVHNLIKLSVITLFLWALKPILSELCVLMTAVFAGEFLGFLCFSYPIKKQKLKLSALERKKTENELAPLIEKEIELRGRL